MSQYGSPPDPNQPDQQGTPPQDPYGAPPAAPNPYGAPPPAPNPYESAQQDSYGGAPAAPYGAGSSYAPVPGLPPGGYAPWIKRVGATLIDFLCLIVAGIPLWIGYGILLSHIHTTTNADGTTSSTMSGGGGIGLLFVLIGLVTYLGFAIWNTFIRQGRTGYTIGKGVMGIRLVDENNGQPIGALMSFLRQVVHIVDSIACYIGYLWPLWDRKCQTFADKIMHTIVVNQPKS